MASSHIGTQLVAAERSEEPKLVTSLAEKKEESRTTPFSGNEFFKTLKNNTFDSFNKRHISRLSLEPYKDAEYNSMTQFMIAAETLTASSGAAVLSLFNKITLEKKPVDFESFFHTITINANVNYHGFNAMTIAAQAGNFDFISIVLSRLISEYKKDLAKRAANFANSTGLCIGSTPAMFAAEAREPEVLKKLIENGADLETKLPLERKQFAGATALSLAERRLQEIQAAGDDKHREKRLKACIKLIKVHLVLDEDRGAVRKSSVDKLSESSAKSSKLKIKKSADVKKLSEEKIQNNPKRKHTKKIIPLKIPKSSK